MNDTPTAELLARYVRRRDEAAAGELFRRYAGRLTALAGSRLSRALSARVDPEDVVQSAYRSFFRLALGGAVEVRGSGDLWRLLARVTLRKVYRGVRRHRAECRDLTREDSRPGGAEAAAFGREPTPADAAALVDELRGVLALLGPVQRRIVELCLDGRTVEAIAAEIRRSTRTVRRALAAFGAELERRLGDVPVADADGLIPFSDVILHRQLGEGGMGKVYRASWHGSDNPVAVKLLRKPLRCSGTAAERFRHEAAVLGRLRHPGIVAVHGVGLLPDGGHFLVMDFVEGGDLARRPRPAEAEAIRWVAEAADALDHAHALGVVHCDVKPGNLLLGTDGHVRVGDFGLARDPADGDDFRGGTAGFMAPEQAAPDGRVSPRTDVFGLGAVLFALLPQRSPGLEAICRRCTTPDPAARYASAAELAAVLRSLSPDCHG